jgi:hypothetical protein
VKLSQASVEYLIILGIALFLLVPIITLFYNTTMTTQISASSKEITLAGTEILATADKVYYQGMLSRVKLTLDFPNNLLDLNISDNNRSLVITADVNGLETDFVFFSNVPISFYGCDGTKTTNLRTGGKKLIFVESCGKYVTIYAFE